MEIVADAEPMVFVLTADRARSVLEGNVLSLKQD